MIIKQTKKFGLALNGLKMAFFLLFLAFLLPAAGSFYVLNAAAATEANLKAGSLGPNISVGLVEYTRSELLGESFRIEGNKAYKIMDCRGNLIAKIPAGKQTKVKYNHNKTFKIYGSIPETVVARRICFNPADGKVSNMVFDIHRPNSSYDEYRGKIKLNYYDSSEDGADRIWVINTLPLELYVWGLGEITGTGDMDYNRVMVTAARTYGYWKIKFSTKYAAQGFKVDATPGNQLYFGYEWEKTHTRIKTAAKYTQGKIIIYKGKIALPPYFSWSDGKTRRYEDGHWSGICDKSIRGTISKIYPWMSSVKDPYGKHPTKSTCVLAKEGNHMVGISAHGALHLAGSHGWSWSKILKYYLKDVSILKAYPK